MLFACLIIGSTLWGITALASVGAGMMSPMAFDSEEAVSQGWPWMLMAGLAALFVCCVIAIVMSWIAYSRGSGWACLVWHMLPIIPSLPLIVLMIKHY